eukprot:1176153-Prorocentrum_minimum.AAC.4
MSRFLERCLAMSGEIDKKYKPDCWRINLNPDWLKCAICPSKRPNIVLFSAQNHMWPPVWVAAGLYLRSEASQHRETVSSAAGRTSFLNYRSTTLNRNHGGTRE